MKTYLELNINERINAKGNTENRGKAYSIKPCTWSAMNCLWIFDSYPPYFESLITHKQYWMNLYRGMGIAY